jgi:hypothetical protein
MKPADFVLCIVLGLLVGIGALALANKPKPAHPGPTVIVSPSPSAPSAPPARSAIPARTEEIIPGLLWISGLEKLRPPADSKTWYHPVRPQEIEITVQALDGQKWTTFLWDKVK